ncbi:uncharacterized protein CC84DRAFT_1257691 [Paraphaeosphaeria sporulosa]|uniref:Uncharacterized protein n=1 Tax=Paraphaeosphaeria sporulosa TaxID=1460663 RepID=A0A177CNT3_9PLEO|nr:uncharacterized protein CC84DRAFT_1257691 [Paraphaeosphaeria sporulosa]OAG08946.1 hypothetical protein CC84DRAFT_1257691 [Paraphaeosphaeria sporulosa]
MSRSPMQRDEARPGRSLEAHDHSHFQGLKEHQKTTISMFIENGINPESIVKATQHGGVQNLLLEAERIVGVADAWQTLYGIDINPLVQLYNKYGRNVVEVCLIDLVQMSQQGLLHVKPVVASEDMPAESCENDDPELSALAGESLDHPSKPTRNRVEPNPVEIRTPRCAPVTGKRPPPSATIFKKSVSSAFVGKRRVVGQVCTTRCTKYMKRQHFLNHAVLKHKSKLPSQMSFLCCCDHYYTDDEAYLDHHWNKHSDIFPVEESEAAVTPREQPDAPYSTCSTPPGPVDPVEF